MSRMQAAYELSALSFQLLGRDVSNSELSEVVSPPGFGQVLSLERKHRDGIQSGEAALKLSAFVCMLDV